MAEPWIERQIAFFREKVNIPTARWDDLWQAQHDRAFVVAGATKADLLADLHGATQRAIEEGRTIEQFRADFDAIVEKHGWTGWTGEGSEKGRAWRARVIYETNIMTSHAAGRFRYLTDNADKMPFWRYKHKDGVMHPRPHHVALNNLVLPATDPFWKRAAPPNGFGCHCYVEGLSRQYMDKHWMTADSAPLDFEPDPGWGYAPGANHVADVSNIVETKAATLPTPIRRDFLRSLAGRLSGAMRSVLDLAVRLLGGS